MSIRSRPPGFSSLICIRGVVENRAQVRLSRCFRTSARGKFVREFTTSAVDGSQTSLKSVSRIRSPRSVANPWHSRFSTCSSQHSETAAAIDDSHLDVSHRWNDATELPENLEKLTVKELRDILSARSLKTSGLKSELIARLRQSSSQPHAAVESQPQPPDTHATTITNQIEGFSRWETMTVKDLRSRLSVLGLPTAGLKSELIERLASVQPGGPQANASEESSVGKMPEASVIQDLGNTVPEEIVSAAESPTAVASSENVTQERMEAQDISPITLVAQPVAATSEPLQAIETSTEPTLSQSSMYHTTAFDPATVPQPSIPYTPLAEHAESIEILLRPTEPEIVSTQSAAGEPKVHSPLKPDELSPINQLERSIVIAELNDRLLTTELSTLRLAPERSDSLTTESSADEPEAQLPIPGQKPPKARMFIGGGAVNLSSDTQLRGVAKDIHKLKGVDHKINQSRQDRKKFRDLNSAYAIDLLLKKSGSEIQSLNASVDNFSKKLCVEKSPASENDLFQQRSNSLAKVYFSKAFEKGIEGGPHTTHNLRFVDFPIKSIEGLQDVFLEYVSKLSKKGKVLWGDDYAKAWMMALQKFSHGEGRYHLQRPDADNKKQDLEKFLGQWTNPTPRQPDHGRLPSRVEVAENENARVPRRAQVDEAQPVVAHSRPPREPTTFDFTEHAQTTSSPVGSPAISEATKPETARSSPTSPTPVRSISAVLRESKTIPPLAKPLSFQARLLSVAKQAMQNMRKLQNLPPQSPDGVLSKWNRSMVESLAASPIMLRLTITEAHRRKFLLRPGLEHIIGNFTTDGDPFCQMFNSMWIRLGLMEYIDSIQQAADKKYDYFVTFKSFEPAAAFVNRVDEHYLDDQMTGQIYATWDSEEDNELGTTVVLMLPKRTLEVWRREASSHNAPMSAYGYPMVEWTKAIWAVLTRMRYSIGRYGDCRRYRVVAEYRHRVVMELAFQNQEMMNHFLQRKTEHYISNSWKDRFFAKRHVRLG